VISNQGGKKESDETSLLAPLRESKAKRSAVRVGGKKGERGNLLPAVPGKGKRDSPNTPKGKKKEFTL